MFVKVVMDQVSGKSQSAKFYTDSKFILGKILCLWNKMDKVKFEKWGRKVCPVAC